MHAAKHFDGLDAQANPTTTRPGMNQASRTVQRLASVRFINAGIGATGSDYGALQVKRDLLSHHTESELKFCRRRARRAAAVSLESLALALRKACLITEKFHSGQSPIQMGLFPFLISQTLIFLILSFGRTVFSMQNRVSG